MLGGSALATQYVAPIYVPCYSKLCVSTLKLFAEITRQLHNERRADYFLSRLVDITMTLEDGLNAVDGWLLDFMTTWDYTLWQTHIFTLFSYLNFFDVSGMVHC